MDDDSKPISREEADALFRQARGGIDNRSWEDDPIRRRERWYPSEDLFLTCEPSNTVAALILHRTEEGVRKRRARLAQEGTQTPA
jgi:hypothetical protein